ncbi:MAG: tetratricopeptide repeat protein [Phycisphaerales bacterium JB059]
MRGAAIVLCGIGVLGLGACQSSRVASVSEPVGMQAGAAPVERTPSPTGADGRPTEFKKLQTWLAVRGLSFSEDKVTIDEAGRAEVLAERRLPDSASSIVRSVELLAINARVRAIGAARDAVLADPGDAQAYRALGTALRTKRKDDRALAAFETAATLDPTSGAIQADQGDARNRVGDRAGAIEAYERAVALDPDDGESHARLAVLRYYTGDDSGAWSSLRAAERLGATVPPQFVVLLSERTPEG